MASKRCAHAEAGRGHAGFTLVELVVSVAIAALLMASLSNTVLTTLSARDLTTERNRRVEDARFVLDRITRSVRTAEMLFLPRPDDPRTAQIESVRDPGALAVTMDPSLDRDRNGIADADQDGDGRRDEDPTGDLNGDLAPGIAGIDDDLDGQVDEQGASGPDNEDDDEDGQGNEDGWNGIDDDGDGWVDEDTKKDLSGEGVAGYPGVDDDGDTQIDEGDKNDDDEDGAVNEDWIDTIVFYLSGSDLIERTPVMWDVNPPAGLDGADYLEHVLAEGVSKFRVERLPAPSANTAPLLAIELQLSTASGDPIQLETLVQLGSGL